MALKEKITLPIINLTRKHFRNTWIHRIPITSWVYKKVFGFTYGGKEKEIVFRGANYLVPTTDTAVVPSMISGEYEHYELDLFMQLLKPGFTVLDVGANIGVYCIEASKVISEHGKVFAFEPIEENLKLLNHNIELNDVKNVEVVFSAIGKEDSKIKIYKAKHSIATHSAGAISDEFVEVPVTSIDSFVSKHDLSVDLIKMDIEGYEGFAIEGSVNTINNQHPVLFIEFSSHHLKQCAYSPAKHAENLLNLYKYCYLINEKNNEISRITDAQKLSKLFNGNLILSATQLAIT